MEWVVEGLVLATALLILAHRRSERQSAPADHATSGVAVETPPEERCDEMGSLVRSLAQMLETIETQTEEISRSAIRLGAAYKELEGANARLEASVNADLAGKDPVTGLYTRHFFKIRLDEEVNRYARFGHPVSVVMVDLDDFHAGDDRRHRAPGHAMLRDVADLLLKHSRGINVIAHYGADEFAVLLVETSKLGAQRYADRIRGIIASAERHGDRVTASFGVATLPEDVPASAEELIRAAHAALYTAKRRGMNSLAPHEGPPPHPVHAGGLPGA